VSRLPREAREGLMRAWLEILRDRHPSVTWVAVEQVEQDIAMEPDPPENATRPQAELVSIAAA
jgi:hypothetical protein